MTMKKAILPAIISALFATSAQAATLYEIDDTSVSLSGELDAFYKVYDEEVDGVETKDEDGILTTFANVQFDLSTKVSDSVTAMGSFEIEADNASEVTVDDAWMGFASDFGTVKVGETGSSYEVMEKTELSNELNEYDAIYSDPANGDGGAVRYENSLGPVALSANYSFISGNSNEVFALSADYAVDENFTIGAAYQNGDKTESWGISGSVAVEGLYAAVTYTDNEGAELMDEALDFTTMAFSASYAFAPATLYGSYQMVDIDDTNTDVDHWYVGVSRDLTANITTFVEYSDTDADDAYEASQLIAGVYYAF